MMEITQLQTPSGLIVSHTKSETVAPGHDYDIYAQDIPDGPLRSLTSIDFQNGPIPVAGINGITNEDLLIILIHRTQTLNAQYPCAENEAAIEFMNKALDAFEARTANRKVRGVEGKMVK